MRSKMAVYTDDNTWYIPNAKGIYIYIHIPYIYVIRITMLIPGKSVTVLEGGIQI